MSLPSLWGTAANPKTYRELVTIRTAEVNASIAAGQYAPFVYPYRSFGPYLVILYFLLPPSRSRLVHYAQYPIFAFCVYWCALAIKECKSASVPVGYGIGLLNAWGCLWISAILIWRDGREVMRRIERVEDDGESWEVEKREETGSPKEFLGGSLKRKWDEQEFRSHPANGSTSRKGPKEVNSKDNAICNYTHPTAFYIWQPLPSDLWTRINWSADLLTNFRLTGWSHQISSIPSPPPTVLSSLKRSATSTDSWPPSPPTSNTGNVRYPTPKALLTTKIRTFICWYLLLDALKIVMMQDPYFWGLLDSAPPSTFPSLLTTSPILTRTYRLLLTLLGTYTALQIIFSLGPLFFVGFLPLVLPAHVYKGIIGARGEVWQYPDMYGSYSMVLRKGLAGWWGGWWHQTFRFAFEAPTTWALQKLGWEKRSFRGKALSMILAFTLSGSLHACGSYSLWPETNPLRGPFAFFVLQPVGVGLQMGFSTLLKRAGVTDRVPMWVRGVGNFAYVHFWFYHVAPLLTDDFARGGIWLMEPVPVSVLRGFGLGLEGEGWWCWHWPLVGWHTGERWWQSGIAF